MCWVKISKSCLLYLHDWNSAHGAQSSLLRGKNSIRVTSILGLCTVESSVRRVERAEDFLRSASTSFLFFTSVWKVMTMVEDSIRISIRAVESKSLISGKDGRALEPGQLAAVAGRPQSSIEVASFAWADLGALGWKLPNIEDFCPSRNVLSSNLNIYASKSKLKNA